MRRAPFFLIALALVAACHRATPQEQAAEDSRAEAMVANAQHATPPIDRLAPEAVSFAELDRPDVAIPLPADVERPRPGEGCRFRTGPGAVAVLAATDDFAIISSAGRLEVFAADSGSPTLGNGLHRDYASGEHAIHLEEAEAAGNKAKLAIRDRYDRVVYSADGGWECGPSPKGPGEDPTR